MECEVTRVIYRVVRVSDNDRIHRSITVNGETPVRNYVYFQLMGRQVGTDELISVNRSIRQVIQVQSVLIAWANGSKCYSRIAVILG